MLFVLSNESGSKIHKYIGNKKNVNCNVYRQPFRLHLIITVECNAYWKHNHCKDQQNGNEKIPIVSARKQQTTIAIDTAGPVKKLLKV